ILVAKRRGVGLAGVPHALGQHLSVCPIWERPFSMTIRCHCDFPGVFQLPAQSLIWTNAPIWDSLLAGLWAGPKMAMSSPALVLSPRTEWVYHWNVQLSGSFAGVAFILATALA